MSQYLFINSDSMWLNNNMFVKCIVVVLGNLFAVLPLNAQQLPYVFDRENTGIDCPVPHFPGLWELPEIPYLPNPFEWSDGRASIAHFSDWKCRRAEIFGEFQHYEVGPKPIDHDTLFASYQNGTLRVEIVRNGQSLILTSPISLPEGEGPFPAIIGMGSPTGSLPANIFTSRDIARVTFNFAQVMSHTQTRGREPINSLYPEHIAMGAYGAWPWGVSRLIDGLELVADELNIDTSKLAVSGCSFAGKMALFSGAFDERIALTISEESGGGGYTTWRYSGHIGGSVENITNTNYAWFLEALRQFQGNVSRLPYDKHELMAMVAPRALLVTGNPDMIWLGDESGYVGSKGAELVYDALGISDRFGYSIIGGHSHCSLHPSQIPDVEAFVDKFLLGLDDSDTMVRRAPYNTDLGPWIPWSAPVLGNGMSYFGKTTPLYPESDSEGIGTSTTLQWEPLNDAVLYRIHLSADPTFSEIELEITTESSEIQIDGLRKGIKYYWRIQVENSEGSAGPWSNIGIFTTFIELPEAPQTGSISVHPTRPDLFATWSKVELAEQYFVQLSRFEDFSSIARNTITVDTFATLQGAMEGIKYYWRVHARNVAGTGPWSDVGEYTAILPPADLSVENSGPNEISLRWRDVSRTEDGYLIQRRTDSEGEFATIDSVGANITVYKDVTAEPNILYIYRVAAYKGDALSAFTNESTPIVVDIERSEGLPTKFAIRPNYPNPFNPSTIIGYDLPVAGEVRLSVFDLLGREVSKLVDGNMIAGSHQVVFDAKGLSSGIYMYVLQAGGFQLTGKMVLMK